MAAAIGIPIAAVNAAWKADRAAKGQVSAEVSDDAIEWHSDALDARFPWDQFIRYRQIKTVPVLFANEKQLLLFPRSLFASEQDWLTFQEFAREKAPSNPGE